MTAERTPAEVRCNAELGPDERAKLDALLDHIHEYGTAAEGVLRLASQLCQAARAAERERWRALLEARAAGCERAAENCDDPKFDAMARVLMSAREDGSRA